MLSSSTLPQEIIHVILDHLLHTSDLTWLQVDSNGLHLPVTTELMYTWFIPNFLKNLFPSAEEPLYKCSLVCRSWLEYSRKIFWSTYPLILMKAERRGIPYSDRLMDIVTQPSCTFTHHIRCLLVYTPGSDPNSPDHLKLDACIKRLGPLLVNYKTLILAEFLFHKLPTQCIDTLMSISKLKTLAVASRSYEKSDLLRFAANFPQLENLTIVHRCTIENCTTNQSPSSRPIQDQSAVLPKLRRLHIPSCFCYSNDSYFTQRLHPAVEALSIYLSHRRVAPSRAEERFEVEQRLLRDVGSTIRTLNMRSHPSLLPGIAQRYPDFRFPLTLEYNTSLVHLQLPTIKLDESQTPPTRLITDLLRTIKSPNLKTLEFHITTQGSYCVNCLAKLDWEALDLTLAHHANLKACQCLRFILHPTHLRCNIAHPARNRGSRATHTHQGGLEVEIKRLLPSVAGTTAKIEVEETMYGNIRDFLCCC